MNTFKRKQEQIVDAINYNFEKLKQATDKNEPKEVFEHYKDKLDF